MRHKKLRGEYETFLSSYNNRKELTLTKIRDIVRYVKDNNLAIKEVCKYLDLKEGDTFNTNQGVVKLIKIQQKGNHLLTFEVNITINPKDYIYLPSMKELVSPRYMDSPIRKFIINSCRDKDIPKGFID